MCFLGPYCLWDERGPQHGLSCISLNTYEPVFLYLYPPIRRVIYGKGATVVLNPSIGSRTTVEGGSYKKCYGEDFGVYTRTKHILVI
ncbi:MAG: hypothetical protein ACKOZZ_09190 [Bacteroidota bacterium]